MGNRACIVFFDHETVSPTVYLHWHGNHVPEWLDELKRMMSTRLSDAAYAAARFVGICHSHIPGNLSLGIESNTLMSGDQPGWKLPAQATQGSSPSIHATSAGGPTEAIWSTSREVTMTELTPNQTRAARFGHVLTRCADRGSEQEGLVDLLTDAMHWCDAHSVGFHYAFAQACRHYIHELNDEQHDERRMIP